VVAIPVVGIGDRYQVSEEQMMIILAPGLVGVASLVMWLFPEDANAPKHYEGDFGNTKQTLAPLDSLSDAESNKIGAFYGYCQGDENK
jgi:hypothetical protein